MSLREEEEKKKRRTWEDGMVPTAEMRREGKGRERKGKEGKGR